MTKRAVTLVIVLILLLANASTVLAGSRPRKPVVLEPAADGQVVHPADVHMATGPYVDVDGNPHYCTTWVIVIASTRQPVWRDACDVAGKVHVHLGDGVFQGPYAARTQLKYGTRYILRVRFAQRKPSGALLWSKWAERRFTTSSKPPSGTTTAWTLRQPNFQLDVFATGLHLPVNIAFLPTPPALPSGPFFYVTELYGSIKVVARDGSVSDYFNGALNYAPPFTIPGSGEQGLTGIVVDPATGDIFASMLHQESDGLNYPRVVRFHSDHGGSVADSSELIFESDEPMGPAHQISDLSIGPDGKLYVHMGDGFAASKAQNPDSYNGKILRMTLGGDPVSDNPFYDAGDGISAKDYVYSFGYRNPFGGAWRSSDNKHYVVENGPSVDRISKLVAGRNYLWDGTDASMANYAIFNWAPSVAPVGVAFLQDAVFDGDFPAGKGGHAFVSESGPTYANGPQVNGKRISEFVFDAGGAMVGTGPTPLIEYTGTGRATASGLAFGPDGLYFTTLYKDLGAAGPTDSGAQVLRVRYVAP